MLDANSFNVVRKHNPKNVKKCGKGVKYCVRLLTHWRELSIKKVDVVN